MPFLSSLYLSQAGQAGSSNASGGPINTLTGNSGGAVGPTGGNIFTVGTGSITVVGNPGGSTLTAQLTGLTNHSVLVGAGTATVTKVGPTATTGQVLQNNAAADPSYSTATYPSTTTINRILYSTANNVVGQLTTAPDAIMITTAGGAPIWANMNVDGYLPIGSSAGSVVTGTLTAGTGISITNGHNSITISATGTTTLNVTPVAVSPYMVAATDDFLAVNSSGGSITVKLPNAPATGRVYYVKDSTGSAAADNILVTTVGGVVTIDGNTTYTMNVNYQSIAVIFDGTNYEVF